MFEAPVATNLREGILIVEDVDEAEDEDGGHVQGQGDQEHEEVPVVPPAWYNQIISQSTNRSVNQPPS